jgi:DNA integrity scanning protein DisA with diadenylate cyclase activity
MTEHHRFYALDRRLRQELVAIDGATVLDSEGRILAVGAILKIDGGSSGGGRLAAAKELSKLGLGIKVSQDGGIRGFHDGNKEEAFIVM